MKIYLRENGEGNEIIGTEEYATFYIYIYIYLYILLIIIKNLKKKKKGRLDITIIEMCYT